MSYQISFGTIHWTTVPEYIDELIDALIGKEAPFVCSTVFLLLIRAHYSIR